MRLSRLPALLALLVSLAACGSYLRLEAPPPSATDTLPVLGLANARFWVDAGPEALQRETLMLLERERALRPSGPLPPMHFLALSGGGDNGAFGAGVMAGWTESGLRPEFGVVTGISAGALIAPFAFLGPDYDPQLREVFTGLAPSDLLILPRVITASFSLIFSDGLADTTPLAAVIERHANEQMLAAIAREYAKGRLLLIGTTNLDLQRPVVWNIGAIAASGHPDALRLFRSVLLASASIPGAFPPVLVDVQHAGQSFQEMHVDGGAAVQVFLYPPQLSLAEESLARRIPRQRTAWVIRNGRVDVEAGSTTRGVLTIARRSAATLLHFAGLGDISRIYLLSQRDGVDFRLTFIGSDFQAERREPFDSAYMQALFDYGRAVGRHQDGWQRRPAGVSTILPQPAAR